MDVNGTRFHLLLGRSDWSGTRLPPRLDWDENGGGVRLAPQPFVFPSRRPEDAPDPAARAGAGRDRFGNWYWVEADGSALLTRAPRDLAPRRFWPPLEEACPEVGGPDAAGDDDVAGFTPEDPAAPASPPRLRGLAVTGEHYLVAGMLEPAGLLVFDLAAGGPPVAIRWPPDVAFAPLDLAPAPDGGLWLLDADHARLWSFDALFRVRPAVPVTPAEPVPPEFEPVAGEASPPLPAPVLPPCAEPPGRIALEASVDVAAVVDATSVEALCDGSALLLGRDTTADAPRLHRYTLAGPAGQYRIAPLIAPHAAVREQLRRAHDVAFVADTGCGGEELAGTIYLAGDAGNQAFAFRVEGPPAAPRLGFIEAFYPMRRFGGRALVSAGGEAHYDSGTRWVALLEQPRARHEQEAALVLPPARSPGEVPAFDSRVPGCVWHRLFLDACVPAGTRVLVESRAADTLAELTATSWQQEPAPYLRRHGSELPWPGPEAGGNSEYDGTWELLFQQAHGRHLQLRLTLQGNGRETPRLRVLRVYYPRFSYLREYLPAVWRDDVVSASFVERFLANVEGTFTEIEGRIAAAHVLFDTATAPAEFLEWLAGWLGATLDPAWDEARRRFFLANAMRMFAARGTRNGLVRALRLALDECLDPELFDAQPGTAQPFGVRIIEEFLARRPAGVAYADIGVASQPGAVPAGAWTPAHGSEALHARWRTWLAAAYDGIDDLNAAWDTAYDGFEDRTLRLPPLQPAGPAGADWRAFLRTGLGFTYAAPGAGDVGLWREFLARRYAQPGDLNRAWQLHDAAAISALDELAFPAELPAAGARLGDWIAFVSVVLPMQRGAHRFTVLVPVALDASPAVQRARRELAERIAGLEKPAHTIVRTRLFWAAFQVGSARLGADSLLGRGSRFAAVILGAAELGAHHLGWTEPWNVAGRRVVGRDAAAIRTPSQGACT